MAKTPCSQCRGALVQSLVRELDPHGTSSQELVPLLAATEGPACHNHKESETGEVKAGLSKSFHNGIVVTVT